jgi:hypothetical protein
LIACLCDSLKFHLLPYLFEVHLSGLQECLQDIHNPRVFFLHEFIEFLNQLAQIDIHLKKVHRVPSKFQEKVLSSQLISYLSSLYQLCKERNDIRKKIQAFIFTAITSYDTGMISLEIVPDLLIS